MRTCTKCGETKPLSEFWRDYRRADGYRARCKPCQYIVNRTTADPVKMRERQREYDARVMLTEARRAARNASAARHPETAVARAKRWRQTPQGKAAHRAATARRKARATTELDAADREISVAYRLAIVNDRCAYCGAPDTQDDHIRPLARGGTDHWWNLCRACEPCNNLKRAHCVTWLILRTSQFQSGLADA